MATHSGFDDMQSNGEYYDDDWDWWNEYQAAGRAKDGTGSTYELSPEDLEAFERDMLEINWGIPTTPPDDEEPPF